MIPFPDVLDGVAVGLLALAALAGVAAIRVAARPRMLGLSRTDPVDLAAVAAVLAVLGLIAAAVPA